MQAVDRNVLENALQAMLLSVLNELIHHQIKGIKLLKRAVTETGTSILAEIEAYFNMLKPLLNLLKPLFQLARPWLVANYAFLVPVFDWAMSMWSEIFGQPA